VHLYPRAPRYPNDLDLRRGGRFSSAILLAVVALSACSGESRPPQANLAVDDSRVLTGFFSPPEDAAPHDAPNAGDAGTADAGAAASNGGRPVTTTNTYHGECVDPGVVQWGFLTYEATTPGDSEIAFRIRSAPTSDALARAKYRDLIRASSALGTRRCAVTGPAPCPVDLYVELDGAPLVHYPFAELEVVLRPSSIDGAMPSLQEWKLTYSCAFQ
jgi:hypothetical protein